MAIDEASIEELIDEGAIESLMEVMRLHPGNEKLMQMFNKLVAKMCINERLADLIGAKMGRNFDVFLNSLKNHSAETAQTTLSAVNALCK